MALTETQQEELVAGIMERTQELINGILDTIYLTLETVSTEFSGVKVVALPVIKQAIDAARNITPEEDNG